MSASSEQVTRNDLQRTPLDTRVLKKEYAVNRVIPNGPYVSGGHDSHLCAAGSVPATGFLKQSGVHVDSKGFIPVNKVC